MKVNPRIYKMTYSQIYTALLTKALKKQRTKEEVDALFSLLTGYTADEITKLTKTDLTYHDFLFQSPKLNPNRGNITGKVCGVDIESIEDPLMKLIRYMDKLIDDLSKGKAVDAIALKYNL